jgi:hypothetical protein
VTSLLIYDEHCGWSPSLNASKGTGGTEVHLVQVATWLAGRGVGVLAFNHYGQGIGCHVEEGVYFYESRPDHREAPFTNETTDALLTVRRSSIPDWCKASRVLTLVTDDPRPEPHAWDHLKGRSTLVCVSDWQAAAYRMLGHECVVIPAMIPDVLPHPDKIHDKVCCVSAWNKGTDRLLDEWPTLGLPWRLHVGSPYSEPDDAEQRCAKAGATWLGRLKPHEIVGHLATSVAHVRVCCIGETFGATDVLATALGARAHVWCPEDVGALDETIPGQAWQTREGWLGAMREPLKMMPQPDFRGSTIMPLWGRLLGVT